MPRIDIMLGMFALKLLRAELALRALKLERAGEPGGDSRLDKVSVDFVHDLVEKFLFLRGAVEELAVLDHRHPQPALFSGSLQRRA